MVVLEATVNADQVEREIEDIDGPQVGVEDDAGGLVGGGGAGAGTGGALAGIASTLGAILGVLAILTQLETVVELFNGLIRILELTLLPIVAVISALLTPVLQDLARLVGNVDFEALKQAVQDLVGSILNGIQDLINQIPGIGPDDRTPEERREDRRQFNTSQVVSNLPFLGPTSGAVAGQLVSDENLKKLDRILNQKNNNNNNVNFLEIFGNEFSNEGLNEFNSNRTQENQDADGPGGSNNPIFG